MFTVRRLGVTDTLLTHADVDEPDRVDDLDRPHHHVECETLADGEMRRRWCAAGMLEAEKSFPAVRGYRQMPALVARLRAHAETVTPHMRYWKEPIAA